MEVSNVGLDVSVQQHMGHKSGPIIICSKKERANPFNRKKPNPNPLKHSTKRGENNKHKSWPNHHFTSQKVHRTIHAHAATQELSGASLPLCDRTYAPPTLPREAMPLHTAHRPRCANRSLLSSNHHTPSSWQNPLFSWTHVAIVHKPQAHW